METSKKILTEEQKQKRREAVKKYYHSKLKHKTITEEQRKERNKNAKSKYHDKYKYQRKILYLCRQLKIDRDEFMKDRENYFEAYTELMNKKLNVIIDKEKQKSPLQLKMF